MTDRELLQLAAKAYWGDEIDDTCHVEWSEADQAIAYIHADNQDHNGIDRTRVWNPLDDDGDVLRLAVRLSIGFKYHRNAPPELRVPRECAIAVREDGRWFAEAGPDESAATRRAIVRAAAESEATAPRLGGPFDQRTVDIPL